MKRREFFGLAGLSPAIALMPPGLATKPPAFRGVTGPPPLPNQRDGMIASGYPVDIAAFSSLPPLTMCRCQRAAAYITKPGCPACERDAANV